MNVALKEANETQYWIELLRDSSYLSSEESISIYDDATELIKLLASIVKSTKQSLGKQFLNNGKLKVESVLDILRASEIRLNIL